MSNRNKIEELKARKRELEERIEALEKETEMPKVYDPETRGSYHDHRVGSNTYYKIPDLKSGTGYIIQRVNTAYIGDPESQGYISVWESRHKAARQWCVNNIKSKIRYHENQTAALFDRLEEYAEYTDSLTG